MARADDRRRASGDGRRATGDGRRATGDGRRASSKRARKREGGFGPWGPPRPPERERRPDAPDRAARPSRLRVRGERSPRDAAPPRSRRRAIISGRPARRRRRPPSDVEAEVLRLGGTRGPWLLEQFLAAADAFANDRDREALTLLRRVRGPLSDAPSVRELSGLAQYRLGNYRAAAKELEAFVELTDAVEQHPVLMDCYRAQRRWTRIEDLWADLSTASPSAELVTEGRIVAAGALADRGRLDDAIALLARKAREVRQPKPFHLRLWYALADLEERAGNLATARELFARVKGHDADFADVTARSAALR